MWSLFELSNSSLDLLLLSLVVQITLFTSLLLLAAKINKKNASARYSLLFPGMLVLLLLSGVSTAFYYSQNSFFSVSLPEMDSAQTPDLVYESFGLSSVPLQIDSALLIDDPLTDSITEADSMTNSGPEDLAIPVSIAQLAVTIWLLGFLLMLTGILRGLHKIDRLGARSTVPSAHELEQLRELTVLANNSRQDIEVTFRLSKNVSGPVLAGVINPVLLLPPGFLHSLSRTQVLEILTHELAHITRRDSLANFLQKIVLAAFWFHPLVHLVDKAIDRAREEICDNHVLQNNQALGYGETLLAVHSMLGSTQANFTHSPVTLGISSPHWKLEQRIEELLDSSRSQSVKLSTAKQGALSTVIATISIALAGCQLQAAENQNPEQRIAELEQQTRELLQQRQELEQQTLALEAQLQQSAQEQQQVNANFQYRQQVLRSINELRSLLQTGNQTLQFDDVAELTQRILDEIAAASQSSNSITLSEQATQTLYEILAELDRNSLDRQQLLAKVTELGTTLDIAPRASTVESPNNSRPAPTANNREILGQDVYEQIVQIQELMNPEDDRLEADWEAAKLRLDQLMESDFENMNSFEKTTTLSFYSNYWLANENYTETINVFERILTIENQRTSARLRALRSLGQLYAAREQWQQSLDNYARWLELSPSEDSVVLQGLSYGHYQLEEFQSALDYWERFMQFSRSSGADIARDKYAFLNGLYFELDMLDEALLNTKEMVVLFNNPVDWQNLRTIYSRLGMLDATEFGETVLDDATASVSLPVSIDYTPFITPLDGEYLPLVATAPLYPSRAAQDGIEGWVLVSFTVNEQGDVIDDSVDVVDADPPLIFNRASIRAATQFKFQPRVTDGIGVPVAGVQYLFRYRLNDDA